MIPLIILVTACGETDQKINRILPDLAIAAQEVDFGEVKVGETAEQEFQIINAGKAVLRIQELNILDNDDAMYTIDQQSMEIAPQEIANVNLSFSPVEFMDYSRTLEIISNDEENPSFNLPIIGIGGDGPNPDLVLDTNFLDFGEVPTGEDKMLYFTVHNQGDADLEIGSTLQSGSGAFNIIGDLDQAILAPGVQTGIVVHYTPFQDNGDSGSLSIPSNDPEEETVTIELMGNGGGDAAYPVASIECPEDIDPPVEITLDGSGSIDPNGESLSYEWSVITQPIGSSSNLGNNTDSNLNYYVDVAGNYQINLTVENQSGFRSSPAECLFYAEPPSDIHIELSWSDPHADLDLHLLKDDPMGFFSFETDCCWCNSNPEWGDSTELDNPVLISDSSDNSIPEIIDISEAAEGEYYVRIHYYSDLGAGQTQATVRIYMSGMLEGQYTQPLIHNQVWDVGFVRWPISYLVEENIDPYANEGARNCQ